MGMYGDDYGRGTGVLKANGTTVYTFFSNVTGARFGSTLYSAAANIPLTLQYSSHDDKYHGVFRAVVKCA